jgi:restriction endonuclease S subunit
MLYEVPQHIASNKVFIVNSSELEGRLDPAFYNPQYYKFINSKTVNWVRLNAITENIKHPPEYKRDFVDEGYQLIRSQNVRPTGIDLSENPVYLAKDVVLSTSAIFPHVNDILIVRSGVNAGDIAVVEDEIKNVTIGADTLLLNVNQEVLPKFVQVYFFTEIGRSLLNRYITGATNKHLNSYSLKHVYFPKIEISAQKKCITIIESALSQKKQKLEQAKGLLENINNSFLSELGIIIQQKSIQSLQDRMFILNFSKISGGRLDPKLYSSSIEQLKQSLFMSTYDKQPLKNFIISSCSGEWGKDELEEVDENKYTKCLVIRATEFDNTYNLRLDNSRVKYRWIENSKLSRMNIHANDLLIEKSGGSEDQPVGRISILTDEILKENRIAYSNFIHKITVEGINPMYLYFYLKTMHNIKITDSMQSQTNGIRNLIMAEYFNQNIVVPPLPKQQEIVDHITSIRQQAKALQEEGKIILEQAKQEVEQMIIG